VALWCGLAALIGHLFPVFFGFKGGKGVATALGVLLGFNLWVGLACMATWMVMAALFRISSLAALTAAALSPVYAGMIMGWGKAAWVVLVMSALLFYRHKSNIRKLIAGEEGRIGSEAPPPQPSSIGLGSATSPSPPGRGRGEGGRGSKREAQTDALRAPPPQPSPASGRGSKREAQTD
jgi:hypothetical protein